MAFQSNYLTQGLTYTLLTQARQAYLTGNKALAKELSAKGQWHNEQMKAAHSKAGEAIFWQRYYIRLTKSCNH